MAAKKNQLAEMNQIFLVKIGIEHSIFTPTTTEFAKSIFDATQTVRNHFFVERFHDYSIQEQGDFFKVVAYLLMPEVLIAVDMSLYRPIIENGDTKMFFANLHYIAEPNDQIAIIIFNKAPYLLNLSNIDIQHSIQQKNIIGNFLDELISSRDFASNELLSLLRKISCDLIPATIHGDTAIGMAIEHALGIIPNSSKEPDYKGIEIKSSRTKSRASQATRVNLFAQVSDWELSCLKSSSAILDTYGYQSEIDGCFKLYCTVSALKNNSQGLIFIVDEKNDTLQEKHFNGQVFSDVAVWLGSKLRDRLSEKHTETFWIEADSIFINDHEHFRLRTVKHTRKPLLTQFLPLMQQGIITMDHLIKRKNGRVSEKGPLFKIAPQNLNKLFPEERNYNFI